MKGPSAATLYGTQAANGVIRVTTKRGRVGAAQWNVWAEGGVLDDPVTYPSTYFSKSVGSNSQCPLFQKALGACQIERLYTLDPLNTDSTTPFALGHRSQLGASVAGGSETFRYFASAETEHETGPLSSCRRSKPHSYSESGGLKIFPPISSAPITSASTISGST